MSSLILVCLLAVPNTALGTTWYRVYGLQQLLSGTNGIDGYIRGSGIVMHDTEDAVSEWLTIYYNPSITPDQSDLEWVQIGQYQGALGESCPGGTKCIHSLTGAHLYYEYRSCNGSVYSIKDLNAPPTANYPVYIGWSGGSNVNDCGTYGGSFYFYMRVGSWTSTPVGTARLNQSWAFPEAALEDRYPAGQTPEHINTTWFGLDNSAHPNNSFGLHLYTKATNAWNLWNQSNTQCCYATTPSGLPNPLVYGPKRNWDAFWVHE